MRKVSAWFGLATLLVLMSSAQAQNDVLKPYVVLILDTSGSMLDTTGSGPTSCGKVDNRINHAVCAINNIVNSYGDMVFSLARFREVTNGTVLAGQMCDANGDQWGNHNLDGTPTIPINLNPSGGDQCSTQGTFCGDCDINTGVGRACTVNANCWSNRCVNNVCADPTGATTALQTTTCTTADDALQILTPLVDGNNASAALVTNGTCAGCSISSGTDPEIWGVSPYTWTPLAGALRGDLRYWQGNQFASNGTTTIWPPQLAGYDPINRDPQNAVFLPKVGETACNPNPSTCNGAGNCTGANCCCATQCRPYVTILLTDGDESCTNFPNTTAAAATLLTTVPHDDRVAINSVSRSSNVVTVSTGGTAHPFAVGDQIIVTGVTDTSFNGAFKVKAVTNSTTFTYDQTGPLATSASGFVGHAASTYRYRIETKPIGFGKPPGDPEIEAIAHAGGAPDLPGVNEGYYASNEADIEIAISQILADSVRSESCNTRDDDCDTRIDEDFTLNTTCQAVWPVGDPLAGQIAVGVCANTGLTVCKLDGTGTQCNAQPNARQTEICNQLDDDCDGLVDENLSCTSCVPTGEICDNKDNDCDGKADLTCRCNAASSNPGGLCDQVGNDCPGGACVCTPIVRDCAITNANGSCPGTQQCTAGVFGACTGPTTPAPESCDGVDNNCDGVCDGFQLGCSEVVANCDPATQTSCPASDNTGDPSHGPVMHPEAGTKCANAVDDDGDTAINDGCPAVGAAETSCADNLDNDSDGSVNDGCPTVANPLIAQNVCHAGVKTCPQSCAGTNTFGICSGEVKPSASDPCNGLDDDCDNVIDEDFSAADCSTNCGVGTTQCVNGNITCNSQPATNDATCNNIDDDCDGKFDENWVCTNNPINGVCSCGTGLVCAGVEKCVNGAVVCQGDPIGVEVCNCLDDNCNNQVDEGTLCPQGSTCTNCQCAFPCAQGEFPCPLGKKCEMSSAGNFCVNDPCFNVTCPAVPSGNAQTCIPKPGTPNEPQCVDTCTQVTCTGNLICFGPAGECRPNNCTTFPDMCTASQSCVNGTCVTNPCQGVTCDTGKYCVGGSCVESCADVECPAGQRCRLGACETDPCGHACPFGQVCSDSSGKCIDDSCNVRVCEDGQWCNPNSQQCEDDPCVTSHVTCPNPGEICRGGTCIDPDSLRPDAGDEAHVTVGGGGGCSTTGNGSMGVLVALAMLGLRRRKRVPGARQGGAQ